MEGLGAVFEADMRGIDPGLMTRFALLRDRILNHPDHVPGGPIPLPDDPSLLP
jgi:hypothetical protein